MLPHAIYLLDRHTSDFDLVYPSDLRQLIAIEFGSTDLPVIFGEDLQENADQFSEVSAIFSTWNMPKLSARGVSSIFPNLRDVYYAAGTVKYFAEPFIENGVSIHSAALVNAKPVIEYATALVMLGAKGFYSSRISRIRHFFAAKSASNAFPGNYQACVGVLGLGRIGQGVAKAVLQQTDMEVLGYDPYVSAEDCSAIGVKKAGLDEVFSVCDVITNHMPDTLETRQVISSEVIGMMKETTVFINTARGAQVDEKALAVSLKKHPLQSAVLDVTYPEPIRPWNALLGLRNVYVTPHIAGSLGNEKRRLGEAMLDEYRRISSGDSPLYSVDPESLSREA